MSATKTLARFLNESKSNAKTASRLKRRIVISTTTLLLSACGPAQVINTDGCAWSKTITLDDGAFTIFVANEHALRGLTDQINDHNDARKRYCAK